MEDELRKRRAFFDSYGSRPGEKDAAIPPGGIRISCPCCGYPTLGERGGYEICELCWWEDDGQDDTDADIVRGGPNHGHSLTEARENFMRFLAMYPPDRDPRMRGTDNEETKRIKHELIALFKRMLAEPIPDELDEIWNKVKLAERALDQGDEECPG